MNIRGVPLYVFIIYICFGFIFLWAPGVFAETPKYDLTVTLEKVDNGVNPDNWNPGDCSQRIYTVENTGTECFKIRTKISTQWYEWQQDPMGSETHNGQKGNWVEWTPDPDLDVVSITTCKNQKDWIKAVDGHWYYTRNGKEPIILLSGHKAVMCLDVCLDGPKTDNQYQGKRFVINFDPEYFPCDEELIIPPEEPQVDPDNGWLPETGAVINMLMIMGIIFVFVGIRVLDRDKLK